MGESLKAKFSRAYENAREVSKVREAALLALMEVSRARSLPRLLSLVKASLRGTGGSR